ncbi:trypsin-like peptidase domain-containing protein [Patescibacteria group bacterium]|nr:trypsin-like peptidase domain-containing protein [Patescibacteria group bacterium]
MKNKFINYLLKILKVLLHPKILLIITALMLLVDYVLFKKLGNSYEDKFKVVGTIFTIGQIYLITGFSIMLVSKLRNIKWYKSIFPLLIFFLISLAVYFRLTSPNKDLRILSSILDLLSFILLFAAVALAIKHIIFFILHLRKQKALIFHHNFKLPLRILIVTAVIGVVVFGVYRIYTLENRLQTIENKLGGPEKLNCNEKDTIDKVRQSVVRIIGGESEGSGFAIKNNGVILTNFHVIEFEPSPKVVLPDNTFETAEIIMADKNADLAIIKINKDLPVISWGDPKELNPAEELLAIGFPLGGQLSGEASVNKGSLSARRRSKDVGVEYLQTDITLTPGVSGGPMVNICGEVEGINTAGLAGLGIAISTDSIKQKWLEMATAKDSLKDIQKITFDDTESAEFAVATFYNYLKVRKLEKAFEILSDNFKEGHSFDYWKEGYEPLLDTTVIKIEEDPYTKDRVRIKLATKNLVEGEIIYQYFEGYWDVKNIDGKWRLWEARIKEVENPAYLWFYE